MSIYNNLIKIIMVLSICAVLYIKNSGYTCFFDILNDKIKRQCDFSKIYYAGTNNTPSTREFMKELGLIEDNYLIIKAEMENIIIDRDKIPSMHDIYNNIFFSENKNKKSNILIQSINQIIYGKDANIFDEIGSTGWKTFNLIMFDQLIPKNASRCPNTIKLLQQIPGMQSALFSILAPGAKIPPHSDPAKGVIRYHLALRIPTDREKCFINVGGEQYNWTEGMGVVFDDAFEHYAYNNTNEERIILFVDILRPIKGIASFLQGLANFANHYHPGVKNAIMRSIV